MCKSAEMLKKYADLLKKMLTEIHYADLLMC
jgi:hypothetical protein